MGSHRVRHDWSDLAAAAAAAAAGLPKYIFPLRNSHCCACFGSTYTKIGTIKRRLSCPLRKDDTQIREAFHIFILGKEQLVLWRQK